MEILILKEAGYSEALLGLSLSYNRDVKEMPAVAAKLYNKDGGHSKFLESICIWLDITAPRYWWQECDTYRVGVSKQSSSTMHTLKKEIITQENFEHPVPDAFITYLNSAIRQDDLVQIKNMLPEGFLQRRIVCTNYKALRHMIAQRKNHRLPEWRKFCAHIITYAQHKEFFDDLSVTVKPM